MRQPLRLSTHLPLFWMICLINGVVFVVGALLLVLSPASVSSDPVLSEVVVISIGLGVMVLTNALLIRWALAPLHRLIGRLENVAHLEPTHLPEEGSGPVLGIARSVNRLLLRLGEESRSGAARALSAQEAERHRIAQELHDEVGQSLTVVLLGLKQVESRAPPEQPHPHPAGGARAPARANSLPSSRRCARAPGPDSTTCAGWLAGSVPEYWRTSGSRAPSLRSQPNSRPTAVLPYAAPSHRVCRRSARRSTSWSTASPRRRSPTPPGTPTRARSNFRSVASAAASCWRSETTAEVSPTSPRAPD